MAKAVTEKPVCAKCGADVREGTAFCYNCGSNVAEVQPVAESIVEDPAKSPTDDKLSRAAEQRRKARVSQRRSNEYVWEPTPDSPLVFIVAALIAAVAFTIVFLTVYWK